MSRETTDLIEAIEGLQDIIDGNEGEPSKAIEEAKEPGLNDNQLAVVKKYEGGDFVKVDDSTTPNLAEKLAAGAELPWTFVLDGVQFVVKASLGDGGDPSRWAWNEEGFHITYLKYDDNNTRNEISILSEEKL